MPDKDSIVHGLDSYTDLTTGKRYAYGTNEEVTSHLDENTKAQILKQIAPRAAGVVGNLADLQRAGALIAEGQSDKFADGVEPPPDRSLEQIQTDAAKAEQVSAALDEAAASVEAAGDTTTTKKSSSKSSTK